MSRSHHRYRSSCLVIGFVCWLATGLATRGQTSPSPRDVSGQLQRIAEYLDSDNPNQVAAADRQLAENIRPEDIGELRSFLSRRLSATVTHELGARLTTLIRDRLARAEEQIAAFEEARTRARELSRRLEKVSASRTASGDEPTEDGTPKAEGSDKPDAAKPDTAKPDTAKPDTAKPDTVDDSASGDVLDDPDAIAKQLAAARRERDRAREQIRRDHDFLADQGAALAPPLWQQLNRGGRASTTVLRFRQSLLNQLLQHLRRVYPSAPASGTIPRFERRALVPVVAELIRQSESDPAGNNGWDAFRADIADDALSAFESFDPRTVADARQLFLELGAWGVSRLDEWCEQSAAGGSTRGNAVSDDAANGTSHAQATTLAVPSRLAPSRRRQLAEWNRLHVPVVFVARFGVDPMHYFERTPAERLQLQFRLERVAGEAAIPILASLLGLERDLTMQVEAAAALARLSDARGARFLRRLGLEEALALERVSKQVLLLEAIHRRESGELEQAIENLQDILRRFAGDYRVHYELGYCALLARKLQLSIQHFRRALHYRPDDQLAHYNLACAYALAGSSEKALDAIRQAIAHGFRDADHIASDSDLESLRAQPRFIEMLQELRRAASDDNH